MHLILLYYFLYYKVTLFCIQIFNININRSKRNKNKKLFLYYMIKTIFIPCYIKYIYYFSKQVALSNLFVKSS